MATPSFVQAAKGTQNGASSLGLTFASAPTNGNTIFLVNNNPSSATILNISQTGVTWVKDKSFTSAFAWTMEVWRGTVAAGAGTSVTINYSGVTQGCAIAEEWNNVNSSPLDQIQNNSTGPLASPATASTGSVVTTSANELIWAGMEAYPSSNNGTGAQTSPTNGFVINTTQQDSGVSNFAQLVTLYKIVTSTGTYNTTTTISSGSGPYYTMSIIASYTYTGAVISTNSNQLMMMRVGA